MNIGDYTTLVNLVLSEQQQPFLLNADEKEVVKRCYRNGFTVAECVHVIVLSRVGD
jgi:hypothetical protein